MQVISAGIVEPIRILLFKQAGKSVNRPQRRAQVVGNRIAECFKLLDDRFQNLGTLNYPTLQCLVQCANFLFHHHLLGNVVKLPDATVIKAFRADRRRRVHFNQPTVLHVNFIPAFFIPLLKEGSHAGEER